MNDRTPKKVLAMLAVLALAHPAARAVAEETPAEKTAGEQSAEAPKNLLRWSTATESENFGYDIYRGESEDGPFERLTKIPSRVPVRPTSGPNTSSSTTRSRPARPTGTTSRASR